MSSAPSCFAVFDQAIAEHVSVVRALEADVDLLERIAREMTRAIGNGKKVLWCGNGGSAADSQHLAAELMGRFRRERRALASIALTTDTSILTAIGNDYGFDKVFQRQVEALCVEGDVVVGISTSGNSTNVCAALETARRMGGFTVAMTGQGACRIGEIADATVRIASKDTARIQEGHILCGHMLCDFIELSVCGTEMADKREFVSEAFGANR
jgi:D-sedoheptulose 7-phosphate isomerase